MSEPPYAADTRAKGWRFELDYEQIEQSDTWSLAGPETRPWLLMLWLVAWKQVPCGSLPSDHAVIAAKLGMSPKSWQRHRAVLLRGWTEASDARMYHATVTTRVLEMVAYRTAAAERRATYRERMRDGPVSHTEVTRDSHVKNATGTGTGTGTKEKEKHPPTPRKRGKGADAPERWAPPPWVPAKEWSDFEEMRAAMRGVPFTDAARNGVVRKLETFKALGHDPAALLADAVTSGHRTVFAPRQGFSNGKHVNKQEAIEASNRAVGDEWVKETERAH